MADRTRQDIEEEKLIRAEQIREDKIAGLARKEKNTKYFQYMEEIEREHAEQAAKNAKDLEEATKKFR